MKNYMMIIIGSILVALFFSACGGGSSSGSNPDTNTSSSSLSSSSSSSESVILDKPLVLVTDENLSETLIAGEERAVAFSVIDLDGMESVTIKVSNEEDIRYYYPESNLSKIDVNETFMFEAGDYNITITAQGIVGGTDENSTFAKTYQFSVEVDTPDSFDFVNMYNQNLGVLVTTNTQTVSGQSGVVTYTTTYGTFVVNGFDTGLATAELSNDDLFAIRLQTSSSYSSTISTTVSGGGVSDSFSVTTKAYVVPISTPVINTIATQNVKDWGGGLATTLLTVSGTDINTGATYSIVSNPTVGGLTINSSTGELIWDKDIGTNQTYSITVRVVNTDGGSDTETFTLNVTDNA